MMAAIFLSFVQLSVRRFVDAGLWEASVQYSRDGSAPLTGTIFANKMKTNREPQGLLKETGMEVLYEIYMV